MQICFSEQIFYINSCWLPLMRTVKNNKTIGLITAHCFVHFLAVALHDYNVKRPETSWFSHFKKEMWYTFLFTFSTASATATATFIALL